jgi:hypothetical protein
VHCIGREEWEKVVSLQPSESVSYLPNLLDLLSPSRREVVG